MEDDDVPEHATTAAASPRGAVAHAGRRDVPRDVPLDVPPDVPPGAVPTTIAASSPDQAYTVTGVIARGGFGEVHAGVDAAGRPVAIKVLHSDLASDPAVVERFEREVRLLALLRHPNVPVLFDVGLLPDGRPYFVMERLEGRTLAGRLAAEGPMGVAECVALLEPLCDVLAAAHARGVIHRDIKPSNVFLADRTVLLDFGIAKLLDDTGPQLTRSRHVVGSPVSIAPEQILGHAVDERADVYGLGILAFSILAGRPPFEGEWAVVERLHLEQPPPSLVERGVPAPVASVVQRALAKRPEDRPPSARALWDELRTAAALGAGERLVTCRLALVPRRPLDELDDPALDAVEQVLPAAIAAFQALGFVLEAASQLDALLVAPERSDRFEAASSLAHRLNRDAASPFATLSIELERSPRSSTHAQESPPS